MITRVDAKGQIVIPAELRRKYGITEGTKMIIIDNGDAMVLKKVVTEQDLRKLQGSLRGSGGLKTLMDLKCKDRDN
ncbi:MAG: AbrB/MazE/SpoVT family DNA-binding domain-containing protein [Syntrophaceae bacterium]|nr:AbrB/MazE/SpoVT family DNA-binding domain-containing protein [Syntrophaceae bacterium]